MRPLPVILVLVGLAAALVATLFFVGRGSGGDRQAAILSAREAAVSEAQPHGAASEPALDSTGAGAREENRAAPAAPLAAQEPSRAARPAGAEVPGVVLTGRVLGNLGRPVEGATIYAAEANGFTDLALDEIDPDRSSWVKRAEATTDREGRFQIRPKAQAKVSVAVRAAGFAPLDREFALSGAERDLGDLALDASVVLSGRVVDASGRPVASARIARLAGEREQFSFFGGPGGAKVAETDAQGAFRVDQLASGPWRLAVTHPDHPDHIEAGETDRPGSVQSGLVFTLEEGVEIQGRVVGAPADVAPSLSVRAVLQAASEEGLASDNTRPSLGAARRARCAADGSFTLHGLQSGRSYRLTAREGEREIFGRARSAPATARAGDRGVELPYRPETALVFQVVDATSGAPIADLSVQAGWNILTPLFDEEGRPGRRFPEGRVRFGNLPARPQAGAAPQTASGTASGGLKLRVEAAGYQAYERSDIAVVEGQDTDLGVVRLERAPVVSVLVLDDPSGAPVADATVTLTEEKPPRAGHGQQVSFNTDDVDTQDGDVFSSGAAQRARTGADGRASVTSLPGKTARLRVRHAGHARFESEPIALPLAESIERTVRLGVGGTVTVEVVDSHGAAISGAEIDHHGPNSDPGELVFSGGDGRTDASGRLAFEHLQAGVHRFRLRQGAGGGFIDVGGGRAFVQRITRQGGSEEEPGWTSTEVGDRTTETLQLVAPARGSLAGHVSEVGKPLGNATLRLSPRSQEENALPFGGGAREAHTDGRGEYLFDGVEEGEYRLEIEHISRAMTYEAEARVREGGNRQDLDLPLAIVEGTVTGEDGKPVAGARMRAERPPSTGGPRRVAFSVMVVADGGEEPEVSVGSAGRAGPPVFTDASGHYSLRGVLPDVELVVEADTKDAQPARSATFRVAADGIKKGIDLRLERGGTIEVSVQRPGGVPAGGYLARAVLGEGDREPKVQVVGPSGTTKLTGLKPGRWRVSLDSLSGPLPGGANQDTPEREVEVKAGETAKASFDVP